MEAPARIVCCHCIVLPEFPELAGLLIELLAAM